MEGLEQGDSAQPLTLDSAVEKYAALLPDEESDKGPAAGEKSQPKTAEPAEIESEDEIEQDEPEAVAEEEEAALSGDEHESEGEDEQEDAPAQPQRYKAKVDGQDVEVTLDEALAGYSRTQDYTRKTQKLAEERKVFESERTGVSAERQQYRDGLAEIEQFLKAQNAEPDWDALRKSDPNTFAQVHAAWQVRKDQIAQLTAEREKLDAKLADDAKNALSTLMKSEGAKLVEAVPEWKDAETQKKGLAALADYGRSVGFSDKELDGIVDHRAVLMLRKAMLYDQSQKQKADAEKKGTAKLDAARKATPGSGGKKKSVSQLTRAKQRLSQTHSFDDAVAAYELSLPDD